jgi:predicted signal transduction protein with EAL and GGDEF domain
MSCQNAQGYYFSRPVPAEKIAQLLAGNWRIANVIADAGEQALAGRN